MEKKKKMVLPFHQIKVQMSLLLMSEGEYNNLILHTFYNTRDQCRHVEKTGKKVNIFKKQTNKKESYSISPRTIWSFSLCRLCSEMLTWIYSNFWEMYIHFTRTHAYAILSMMWWMNNINQLIINDSFEYYKNQCWGVALAAETKASRGLIPLDTVDESVAEVASVEVPV